MKFSVGKMPSNTEDGKRKLIMNLKSLNKNIDSRDRITSINFQDLINCQDYIQIFIRVILSNNITFLLM